MLNRAATDDATAKAPHAGPLKNVGTHYTTAVQQDATYREYD
jgi:hypothetical protein